MWGWEPRNLEWTVHVGMARSPRKEFECSPRPPCFLKDRKWTKDQGLSYCWCFKCPKGKSVDSWLLVSTHLKNISQNGNLPQIGMNIKTYLKPPPRQVFHPTIYRRQDFYHPIPRPSPWGAWTLWIPIPEVGVIFGGFPKNQVGMVSFQKTITCSW